MSTPRNYRTPGRLASIAAARTEPGAPRARAAPTKPAPPPRESGPCEPKLTDIQWRPESEVDADPECPPSRVPLSKHHETTERLRASIEAFRAAGFWPNTVSALVGLCREDCDRLVPPPAYQLKKNQTTCKRPPASKAKSPKK